MSIKAEPIRHEDSLEDSEARKLEILNAILVGIALITGSHEPEDLIELGKEIGDD